MFKRVYILERRLKFFMVEKIMRSGSENVSFRVRIGGRSQNKELTIYYCLIEQYELLSNDDIVLHATCAYVTQLPVV